MHQSWPAPSGPEQLKAPAPGMSGNSWRAKKSPYSTELHSSVWPLFLCPAFLLTKMQDSKNIYHNCKNGHRKKNSIPTICQRNGSKDLQYPITSYYSILQFQIRNHHKNWRRVWKGLSKRLYLFSGSEPSGRCWHGHLPCFNGSSEALSIEESNSSTVAILSLYLDKSEQSLVQPTKCVHFNRNPLILVGNFETLASGQVVTKMVVLEVALVTLVLVLSWKYQRCMQITLWSNMAIIWYYMQLYSEINQ